MDHIVKHCPITRFSGGFWLLHQADDDAVSWLSTSEQAMEEELNLKERALSGDANRH